MKGNGTTGLRRPVALLQHNGNVIVSLMEVGVLGRIPLRLSEIAFAPLWGVAYIFFTWFITHRLVESGEPQCVYFFFDPTLGGRKNCLVLITLLVAQAAFFFLFTLVDDFVMHIGGGLPFNLAFIVLVSSVACRYRD